MTTNARPDRTSPAATTRRVLVVAPGGGHTLPGPEGITLKAVAADTGGAIGVWEATSLPGFGPPRHIHHDADEWFYILSGRFQFLVGDRIVHAGPGSFVYIPRGTVHAPKVVSTEPARVLSGFIPGGQEQAFEEFALLAAQTGDGNPNPGQAQALAARYNSEFVGPPL